MGLLETECPMDDGEENELWDRKNNNMNDKHICPKCGNDKLHIHWFKCECGFERHSPQFPQGTEASVCADIAERQKHGFAKYGTTVRDNPLSLKQWLQHAYEETLDKAVYLKRAIEESDAIMYQLREVQNLTEQVRGLFPPGFLDNPINRNKIIDLTKVKELEPCKHGSRYTHEGITYCAFCKTEVGDFVPGPATVEESREQAIKPNFIHVETRIIPKYCPNCQREMLDDECQACANGGLNASLT